MNLELILKSLTLKSQLRKRNFWLKSKFKFEKFNLFNLK